MPGDSLTRQLPSTEALKGLRRTIGAWSPSTVDSPQSSFFLGPLHRYCPHACGFPAGGSLAPSAPQAPWAWCSRGSLTAFSPQPRSSPHGGCYGALGDSSLSLFWDERTAAEVPGSGNGGGGQRTEKAH